MGLYKNENGTGSVKMGQGDCADEVKVDEETHSFKEDSDEDFPKITQEISISKIIVPDPPEMTQYLLKKIQSQEEIGKRL
jgi:hypothetical protein